MSAFVGLAVEWHAGTGLQRNYGKVLLHDPDVAHLVDPQIYSDFNLRK